MFTSKYPSINVNSACVFNQIFQSSVPQDST